MRKNALDSEESKFRRLQNPNCMTIVNLLRYQQTGNGAEGQYKVSALKSSNRTCNQNGIADRKFICTVCTIFHE